MPGLVPGIDELRQSQQGIKQTWMDGSGPAVTAENADAMPLCVAPAYFCKSPPAPTSPLCSFCRNASLRLATEPPLR
jgi:hypothetical protein